MATGAAAGADAPPPPPADPQPTELDLPADWRSAKDAQGRTYYYHKLTRQTQWEPPLCGNNPSAETELSTPTHGDSKKVKTSKHHPKATAPVSHMTRR